MREPPEAARLFACMRDMAIMMKPSGCEHLADGLKEQEGESGMK